MESEGGKIGGAFSYLTYHEKYAIFIMMILYF